MQGVRVCSSFIDLHAGVQVSQQYLLRRLSFSHYIFLPLCQRLIDHSVWVYFWVLCSVPLVCMSVLVPVPHSLDYCGFVILPEVWESYASSLVFVYRIALTILGLLWFHIKFWNVCSSSVKNALGNLIGIALNR